jgi:hypothetical protein
MGHDAEHLIAEVRGVDEDAVERAFSIAIAARSASASAKRRSPCPIRRDRVEEAEKKRAKGLSPLKSGTATNDLTPAGQECCRWSGPLRKGLDVRST